MLAWCSIRKEIAAVIRAVSKSWEELDPQVRKWNNKLIIDYQVPTLTGSWENLTTFCSPILILINLWVEEVITIGLLAPSRLQWQLDIEDLRLQCLSHLTEAAIAIWTWASHWVSVEQQAQSTCICTIIWPQPIIAALEKVLREVKNAQNHLLLLALRKILTPSGMVATLKDDTKLWFLPFSNHFLFLSLSHNLREAWCLTTFNNWNYKYYKLIMI